MLTAKGQESDVVRGLAGGADDYIIKPFAPRELIARINVALIKAGKPARHDRRGRSSSLHRAWRRRYWEAQGDRRAGAGQFQEASQHGDRAASAGVLLAGRATTGARAHRAPGARASGTSRWPQAALRNLVVAAPAADADAPRRASGGAAGPGPRPPGARRAGPRPGRARARARAPKRLPKRRSSSASTSSMCLGDVAPGTVRRHLKDLRSSRPRGRASSAATPAPARPTPNSTSTLRSLRGAARRPSSYAATGRRRLARPARRRGTPRRHSASV